MLLNIAPKIQLWPISDKNIRHFTLTPKYLYDSTVEPDYNDIGLRDATYITPQVLSYQLIPRY
jgi:hypothetical protein